MQFILYGEVVFKILDRLIVNFHCHGGGLFGGAELKYKRLIANDCEGIAIDVV